MAKWLGFRALPLKFPGSEQLDPTGNGDMVFVRYVEGEGGEENSASVTSV